MCPEKSSQELMSRPPYPPELWCQMMELVCTGPELEELVEEVRADRDEGRRNDSLISAGWGLTRRDHAVTPGEDLVLRAFSCS